MILISIFSLCLPQTIAQIKYLTREGGETFVLQFSINTTECRQSCGQRWEAGVLPTKVNKFKTPFCHIIFPKGAGAQDDEEVEKTVTQPLGFPATLKKSPEFAYECLERNQSELGDRMQHTAPRSTHTWRVAIDTIHPPMDDSLAPEHLSSSGIFNCRWSINGSIWITMRTSRQSADSAIQIRTIAMSPKTQYLLPAGVPPQVLQLDQIRG